MQEQRSQAKRCVTQYKNIPWAVSNVVCTVGTVNKALSQTLREFN